MAKRLKIIDIPHMDAQWDDTKNELNKADVSVHSATTTFWKCKKCSYEWSSSPKARFRSSGKCPCCESGKAIQPGYNDVLTLVPDAKAEYDFEKNKDIDITKEGVASEKIVFWLCKDCGKSWNTSIISRIHKNTNGYFFSPCTHYNTRKKKKDEVSNASDEPKIMRFWDFDSNDISPSDIKSNNDTSRIYFTHKKCNYHWDSTARARMRSTGLCPCCEVNGPPTNKRVNNVFALLPDLKLDFNQESNPNIDITTTSLDEPINWICHKCNYPFTLSTSDRITRKNKILCIKPCKVCSMKQTIGNTPNLIKYWDYENNTDLNPFFISATDENNYAWHCKVCGNRWTNSAYQQNRRTAVFCDNCDKYHKTQKGINDLLTIVPQAATLYDFDKNKDLGIDIYKLSTSSKQEVYWLCDKCGHSWFRSVKLQIKRNSLNEPYLVPCQNCSKGSIRHISYAEEYPELDNLYDTKLNDIPLKDITTEQARENKYWWKCNICNESYDSFILSMTASIRKGYNGCPYCAHIKLRKGESFGDLHPELIEEYSPNNQKDIFTVFPNDKSSALWICKNNPKHTWNATFALRHMGSGKCPICNRTQLIKGLNTFADVYPELVSQYSPNNERKADDIFYNSTLWFKWICGDCNGEYGAYIDDILNRDDSCPYCNNRMVLPDYNSLGHLYPHLIPYWSDNNEKTAYEVFPFTVKPSKWICPDCSGEFNVGNNDFVNGTYSCPYCENRKVLPGKNSFDVLQPDLMKEWHWSANNLLEIYPNFISDKNNNSVWWLCSQKHSYTMSPSDKIYFRTRKRESCPYCKGLRRKKRHFI